MEKYREKVEIRKMVHRDDVIALGGLCHVSIRAAGGAAASLSGRRSRGWVLYFSYFLFNKIFKNHQNFGVVEKYAEKVEI